MSYSGTLVRLYVMAGLVVALLATLVGVGYLYRIGHDDGTTTPPPPLGMSTMEPATPPPPLALLVEAVRHAHDAPPPCASFVCDARSAIASYAAADDDLAPTTTTDRQCSAERARASTPTLCTLEDGACAVGTCVWSAERRSSDGGGRCVAHEEYECGCTCTSAES